MIQRLSHTCVLVLDQEAAKQFYVDQLGFEVHTDAKMGDMRWLTLTTKAQPDFEIALMPVAAGPMMDQAAATTLRGLVEQGVFSGGVLETDDCHATYEALSAKGVRFIAPPTERPYGIEALLRDNSGNWFSLTQRPR